MINHFKRELDLIQDEELRSAVIGYLEDKCPKYFWEIGASSSGKFHPQFSQDKGGLVRHTKAVVMFAEELLRLSTYSYMREEYKDYAIAACIIHDTCKYGMGEEMNTDEYPNHARNAAKLFKEYCNENDFECSEYLLDAIRAHMGQWSTPREDKPFTTLDRLVHLADYMASRAFIDIPQITQEWNNIENEEDLPF